MKSHRDVETREVHLEVWMIDKSDGEVSPLSYIDKFHTKKHRTSFDIQLRPDSISA